MGPVAYPSSAARCCHGTPCWFRDIARIKRYFGSLVFLSQDVAATHASAHAIIVTLFPRIPTYQIHSLGEIHILNWRCDRLQTHGFTTVWGKHYFKECYDLFILRIIFHFIRNDNNMW